MLFARNQKIFNYTVVFPLNQRKYTETYSVKDENGIFRFLKLIDTEKLPSSYFDEQGRLYEIEICKRLHHPNICNFMDSAQMNIHGRVYSILVTEYISCETLEERIRRCGHLSVYEIKKLAKAILKSLQYIHTQKDPIIHNAVTIDNILLDLSGTLDNCKLSGFSHSCFLNNGISDMEAENHDSSLIAPERRNGIINVQSDIYSVGLLIFQLLYERLPEESHRTIFDNNEYIHNMCHKLQDIPTVPIIDKFELDDNLLRIIVKAIQHDPAKRFKSAQEMLDAFDDPSIAEDSIFQKVAVKPMQTSSSKSGNGFDDIAGMQKVKDLLLNNVINILKDTARAKEYRIFIPNGMLLYGPPGCGKSFFAEKFAEETGFHYKYVKSSDLASVYIHGTQEKIGQLFQEAREKSPTILCFDEFDALVPKRDSKASIHHATEVNEFLTQLNNCGKDNVFVIATTNRPDMIDPAILRRGRIDNIIYLPPPDAETRKAIFQVQLRNRPCESSIDYEKLADLTKLYISSDIAFIVNEAAIRAYGCNSLISQALLESIISESKPSLSLATLKYYEDLRKQFERGSDSPNNPIGFHL